MADKAVVAKNVGVSVEALDERIVEVLEKNEEVWLASGKSADECAELAVSVAGRQLKSEAAKLARSGAEIIEGMFVSVPRYKDWGANAFRKMAETLSNMASEQARNLLIAQGRIQLIEDNLDGTYTLSHNPHFRARTTPLPEEVATRKVTELPKEAYIQKLDESTWFQIIENNEMPYFQQSGDENPRWGRPRATTQPERTCLFLGRKKGSDETELFTIKTDGELAKTQFAAFTPGRIAVSFARNGVGYGRNGVTVFETDESLASIFPVPPLAISEDGTSGLAVDLVGGVWPDGDFLPSFSLLSDHIARYADTNERWDKLCATIGEVFHIDPRDNGGYDVEVGDLDITSTAEIQKFYIPPNQTDLLTFGVGSKVLLIGNGWNTREGESRLSVTGWWVVDAIQAAVPQLGEDEDSGWDAE